jgi:amino acid transporter
VSRDKSSQRSTDAAQLEKLGYAQQLLRDMGGFANFALSFSIISILTGAVSLYGYGLTWGGPFVMTVGWPVVTVMTLFVAVSLAELASAYPTAGALYHWASILGGPRAGFFTAWLNTIGQFAITAGIDYACAEFVSLMLGMATDRVHVLPIFVAILLSHAALNHVGVRAVSLLNWLSSWYHLAGVALMVGALVVLAPRQDAAFLLAKTTASEHGYLYGFLVGLLQAQWTFTGYDASAHVTEETLDPSRNAPWGIFLSVAVSGVVGYAMLLAVTLSIPDLPALLAGEGNPFVRILELGLGPRLGAALIWMTIGAMWFCGLASVTSNSRMLFAFARDGGLPGSRWLARVSPTFQSPHVAVWTACAAALVVALWGKALSAMTALSTIALYASYALPIALGLRARASGRWHTRGPWHLGRWSTLVNVLALVWVAVISVVFVLPPNQLTGQTFAVCVVLLSAYWTLWMRGRFSGPRIER